MRSPCAQAATAAALGALATAAAVTAVGAIAGFARSGGARPAVRAAVAPQRPPPAPLPRLSLVAGGDVALTGTPDPGTFAGVARFLRPAGVAVANLEGTLTTAGPARCVADAGAGCFVFRASPGWSRTLARAGFTYLNVANNHALDFGLAGRRSTLAALRSAGIAYGGLPGQVTYLRAGPVEVALIGCAPYPWAQELLDTPGTQRLVRAAARHADVVVVYLHAGAEGARADRVADVDERYLGERRGNPLRFAHALVDAGADLVLASGPHVLRGLEWYRGRLVAYSLGDLAGTHTLSTAGVLAQSVLLRVTLDARGRFVEGSLVPLRLDARGTPRYDARGVSLALVRRLSARDFGASAPRVGPGGRVSPPGA